ncbi:phytoene desaturase family protein [Fangia hongkongensis]|uniref:phytoene desaturase family protein n=3 Tax=Fangia hongkongensis TaxID=270495 RepID=UPI000361BCD7|nr:NAD(P)/FAD-dependent oxidoreductase [Fangia hongkongensis]
MSNEIIPDFIAHDIENHYEAIVIGSGIGGLVAANYLANAGVKVLLIEQHQLIGGYFHGGWHKKNYFDYGTQSHEILGALLPIVRHLGIEDQIKFKKCQHSFVSENGLSLKMGNMQDARNSFSKAYVESQNDINNYFDYYEEVYEVAKSLNLDGMGELIKSNTRDILTDYDGYWLNKQYHNDMMKFDSIISSRKARSLLGRSRVARILSNFGYRNQSVLASGLFWHLWKDDYYYTENGNQDFANKLAMNIIAKGGAVAIGTSVIEIITEGEKVTGVRLGDKSVVHADYVICNTDLVFALETLLKGHPLIHGLMNKAKKTPTSEAFFSSYIGTSIPVDELKQALNNSHHTWYFPDSDFADPFDINFHKNLPVEISAPVLQNPNMTHSGGSQVVLQCFSSIAWMNHWKINRLGKRTKDYLKLKAMVGQQLIENVEKYIPGFSESINFKMHGAPMTHTRYTGNYNGATAGWTWNPKRTLFKLNEQGVTTPFENLYFAGHWTLYPGGLLTAAVSGKMAADQIIYR